MRIRIEQIQQHLVLWQACVLSVGTLILQFVATYKRRRSLSTIDERFQGFHVQIFVELDVFEVECVTNEGLYSAIAVVDDDITVFGLCIQLLSFGVQSCFLVFD